jgi:selenide, water dikinase
VTGFGLAGHLMEMLEASRCGAELRLADVPFLPGAVALARQGEGSSIAPANRAAVLARIAAPRGPEVDLLFDPQTCGGLLAAVPETALPGVMAAMAALGEPCFVIGCVTGGPPMIRVLGGEGPQGAP